MIRKFFYLFAVLLFIRCETNPPLSAEDDIKEFGKVFISANISGAEIFLNDVNTGKLTPDTIAAPVGPNSVKVQKDGFATITELVEVQKDTVLIVDFILNEIVSKIVLLEDFANVSCTPCVTSNKIIEQLVNKTYGTKKLIAIKFPTNFPSPNDPFYNANKPDCDARRTYYSVIIAPTTIIDGVHKPISTDSTSIKEKIETQLQQQAQFKLEVTDSISGNIYFAKVRLTMIDNSNIALNDLVLHTVLTETDIEFATAPGSNGETKFFDVMRKMMPSNQGQSLSSIELNTEVSFEFQTELNAGWNLAHLNSVVFIQNRQTKEVYQANSTF